MQRREAMWSFGYARQLEKIPKLFFDLSRWMDTFELRNECTLNINTRHIAKDL
jgi:hypothetical protein